MQSLKCTLFYQSLTYEEVSDFGIRHRFMPWVGGKCLLDEVISGVPIAKSIEPSQTKCLVRAITFMPVYSFGLEFW